MLKFLLLVLAVAHAQRRYDRYLPEDTYFRENCENGAYRPYNSTIRLQEDLITFQREFRESVGRVTDEEMKYINGLFDEAFGPYKEVLEEAPTESIRLSRTKRGAPAPRERKEYRSMTASERSNYHAAVNALKADLLGGVPKYDIFVRLHRGNQSPFAHQGPAFLPWHRVFLYLYETALRQYYSDVTLPYWDSSIDRYLVNPSSSIIWTPAYLGNAIGNVVTGPFAGWIAENGQPLRRDTTFNIAQIYSNSAINSLQSSFNYSIYFGPSESNHNGVHGYVGGATGAMNNPASAPDDPVFYMHHTFVDCLWGWWRNDVQVNNVADIETDYAGSSPPGHGFNERMRPFPVNNNFGLRRHFERLYSCAPRVPPVGSDDCCCSDVNTRPNGQYDTYSTSPVYPPPTYRPSRGYKGPQYTEIYTRVRIQYEGRNPYRDSTYTPYDPYLEPYRPPAVNNECCDTHNQYVIADCEGRQYGQYGRGYTSVSDRYSVSESYIYFPMRQYEGEQNSCCYLRVYTPGGGRPCRPYRYDGRSGYVDTCSEFCVGPNYPYTPRYDSYQSTLEDYDPRYGESENDVRVVQPPTQYAGEIVFICPNSDPLYKENRPQYKG